MSSRNFPVNLSANRLSQPAKSSSTLSFMREKSRWKRLCFFWFLFLDVSVIDIHLGHSQWQLHMSTAQASLPALPFPCWLDYFVTVDHPISQLQRSS